MTEKEILQSQIEEAQRRLQQLEQQEKTNKKSEYIKELSEFKLVIKEHFGHIIILSYLKK